MAIIERIPVNQNGSRVRYPAKRFSAAFAAGQYDFGVAGNNLQRFMKLASNSLYLIERINFFASVPVGVWLSSMDTEVNFPSFRLSFKNGSADTIYPEPVRCVNYIENGEQLIFFKTTRENEELLISFAGKVNQVPEMVGIDPLLSEVNMTIYQITDSKWVEQFNNPDYFDPQAAARFARGQ